MSRDRIGKEVQAKQGKGERQPGQPGILWNQIWRRRQPGIVRKRSPWAPNFFLVVFCLGVVALLLAMIFSAGGKKDSTASTAEQAPQTNEAAAATNLLDAGSAVPIGVAPQP